MKIYRTAAELLAGPGPCVVVPTMGALHEGHAALVRAGARVAAERSISRGCVVTNFVNPTQFNEKSDFDRYPRTLDADAAICEAAGAAAVFAPSVEEVYPPGQTVPAPPLPDVAVRPGLEDAHRPGHFAGVCQVVRRLFELTRPSAAIFGEKDWQQLQVVRAMTAQENLSIEIVGMPTIRERTGLAMSSRNVFLGAADRVRALAISRALAQVSRHDDIASAERSMRDVLAEQGITPEYAVVRDAATLLAPASPPSAPRRALIAARVGPVRLIDNAAWTPAG